MNENEALAECERKRAHPRLDLGENLDRLLLALLDVPPLRFMPRWWRAAVRTQADRRQVVRGGEAESLGLVWDEQRTRFVVVSPRSAR